MEIELPEILMKISTRETIINSILIKIGMLVYLSFSVTRDVKT